MVAIKYIGDTIIGTNADRTGGTWTTIPTGYRFFETDTGLEYYWNGTAWSLITGGNLREPYAYFVYKSGSTYYAKNGITNTIDYSGSVASTVIQSTVTATLALTRGGIIQFSADDFPFDTYLDIPTATSPKPIGFRGVPSLNRSFGTYFSTTTSFPTNRSFIETSGATDGSNKYVPLYIKDIGMYNINITTINAGGIKYDIDSPDFKRPIIVDGLRTSYLVRDIHLLGPVWWGLFNDIHCSGASASFTMGDCNIKLEQGSHTAAGINPWPKANVFSNVIIDYVGGGIFTNSLNADAAGYNVFRNYQIEGGKFTNAIFYFTNKATDNIIENPLIIDITAPTPDNRVGTVVFDGAAVYNNHVYNGKLPRNGPTSSGYTIAFKNGAYRNSAEISGKWGSTAHIDNVGTGDYNTVEVLAESEGTAATAPIKLTTTGNATENGKLRIIDKRKGAYTTGVSTQSGDATTKAFNIVHLCYTTPLTYTVLPQTADAAGTPVVTATSTNLVVTYPIAPPTGSSNLIFVWTAGVY